MKRIKRDNETKLSKHTKFERNELESIWTEYYLQRGYANDVDRNENYVKDSSENEKVFENAANEQIYAKKTVGGDEIEYAPKDKDGYPIYIRNSEHRIRLPRNITKDKIVLPKDINGDDKYIEEGGELVYTMDKDGYPVYAYNRDGNVIFLEKEGKPYYAKNNIHREIYPKDADDNEIYLKYENVQQPAVDETGAFYYAKNNDGNEYYPRVFVNNPSQKPEKIDIDDQYEVDYDKGIILVKD